MIVCTIYLTYSVLEDDDVAILDLISRVGGDLTQPRGLSGSATRVPDVDSYTRDGMFISSMEMMIRRMKTIWTMNNEKTVIMIVYCKKIISCVHAICIFHGNLTNTSH